MTSSQVKKLVERVSPPILFDLATKLWRRARGIGFSPFEGHYRTLADVPVTPDSYNDSYVVERIVQSRMVNLMTIAEPDRLPKPEVETNGRSILPLLAAVQLHDSGTLRVVDFGGGLGVGLVHCLNRLTTSIVTAIHAGVFEFHIVETPAMCTAIRPILVQRLRERFGTADFLHVHELVPSLPLPPSIVNVATSIQYIPDYLRTLSELAALGPKYIVFSETPMRVGERYARMQNNMPRCKLAQWVFNYADFVSEMSSRGYSEVFRASHDLPLSHRNPPPGAPTHVVSIVFRRIAQ